MLRHRFPKLVKVYYRGIETGINAKPGKVRGVLEIVCKRIISGTIMEPGNWGCCGGAHANTRARRDGGRPKAHE